jgi:hypothetical protein
MRLAPTAVAVALAAIVTSPVLAVEPGHVTGTLTVDSSTAKLAFAASYQTEGLFDSTKQDTMVVLTDRALGDVLASDEVELAQRAAKGELVVLTLRLSGDHLVNAAVNHQGVEGTTKLPGQWFDYRPGKAGAGQVAGALTLAKHAAVDHTWACAVEFLAVPAAPASAAEAVAPVAAPAATPTLPPATTSNLDPKSLVPLLVKAIMDKDEDEAVKIVKLGADPNGRDQYGTPVLNWAVMTCMPRTVQALVDAKAKLDYERAPGMTILQEAGACPEAAKILRAAGAK